MVKFYNQDSDLLIRLITEKLKKYNSPISSRFNSTDIKTIFNLIKNEENRKLVIDALNNYTNEPGWQKGKKPSFTADNIVKLVELSKKYPELMNRLVNEETKSIYPWETGESYNIYDFDDIELIVQAYEHNKTMLFKYLDAKNFARYPRFKAKEVLLMMKIEEVDKPLAEKIFNLMNSTNDYKFGNGNLIRFIENFISQEDFSVKKESLEIFKKMLDIKDSEDKANHFTILQELLRDYEGNYDLLNDIVDEALSKEISLDIYSVIKNNQYKAKILRNLKYTDNNGKEKTLLSMQEIAALINNEHITNTLVNNPEFRQFIAKIRGKDEEIISL